MTAGPLDATRILFEFILPQLRSEHAVTHKVIAAVPVGEETYRPGPTGMTAFELARHIALCEVWFMDAVIHGRFSDDTPMPATTGTCRDVATWYAEHVAQRLPLLSQLTSTELGREVDYIGLRNDPAVAYLSIAIRHSVHHRGQLSAYLRAMGAKVPAIYVESADEPYPPPDGSVPTGLPPCF